MSKSLLEKKLEDGAVASRTLSRLSFASVGKESLFSNPYDGDFEEEDEVQKKPQDAQTKENNDFDSVFSDADAATGSVINRHYALYDDVLRMLTTIYTKEDDPSDIDSTLQEFLTGFSYEPPKPVALEQDFFSGKLEKSTLKNAVFSYPEFLSKEEDFVPEEDYIVQAQYIRSEIKKKFNYFMDTSCPNMYVKLTSKIENLEKKITEKEKQRFYEKQLAARSEIMNLKAELRSLKPAKKKPMDKLTSTIRKSMYAETINGSVASNTSIKSEVASTKRKLAELELRLLNEGLLTHKYKMSFGKFKFMNGKDMHIEKVQGRVSIVEKSEGPKNQRLTVSCNDFVVSIGLFGLNLFGNKISRIDLVGNVKFTMVFEKSKKHGFRLKPFGNKFSIAVEKTVKVEGKPTKLFGLFMGYLTKVIFPNKVKSLIKSAVKAKIHKLSIKDGATAKLAFNVSSEFNTMVLKTDLCEPTPRAYIARQALGIGYQDAVLLQTLFLNLPGNESGIPRITMTNILQWTKRFDHLSYNEIGPYINLIAFENERLKDFMFHILDRVKIFAQKKVNIEIYLEDSEITFVKPNPAADLEGFLRTTFKTDLLYTNAGKKLEDTSDKLLFQLKKLNGSFTTNLEIANERIEPNEALDSIMSKVKKNHCVGEIEIKDMKQIVSDVFPALHLPSLDLSQFTKFSIDTKMVSLSIGFQDTNGRPALGFEITKRKSAKREAARMFGQQELQYFLAGFL